MIMLKASCEYLLNLKLPKPATPRRLDTDPNNEIEVDEDEDLDM